MAWAPPLKRMSFTVFFTVWKKEKVMTHREQTDSDERLEFKCLFLILQSSTVKKVKHGQKCLRFTTLRVFVCAITSKKKGLAPQPKRHKERIRWIQRGREWERVPKGGRERGRDIICWKWMAAGKVELCISVWPVRFNPALSVYSESLLSDILSKLLPPR